MNALVPPFSAPMPSSRLDAHLQRLFACRACPGVEGRPVTGAVGGARILLVGQAPGPHEAARDKPFAWTAGRRLFAWFASLGAAEPAVRERIYIAAIARCFPGRNPKGGDRTPSPDEIARCAEHLDRELRILRPALVLCVGTLAAREILGRTALAELVGRTHRARRAGHEFDAVVLPHPSGRSTWLNHEDNRAALARSLELIAEHPAWRATFGRDATRARSGNGVARTEGTKG